MIRQIYLLVLEEQSDLTPRTSIVFAPFALPASQASCGKTHSMVMGRLKRGMVDLEKASVPG